MAQRIAPPDIFVKISVLEDSGHATQFVVAAQLPHERCVVI